MTEIGEIVRYLPILKRFYFFAQYQLTPHVWLVTVAFGDGCFGDLDASKVLSLHIDNYNTEYNTY